MRHRLHRASRTAVKKRHRALWLEALSPRMLLAADVAHSSLPPTNLDEWYTAAEFLSGANAIGAIDGGPTSGRDEFTQQTPGPSLVEPAMALRGEGELTVTRDDCDRWERRSDVPCESPPDPNPPPADTTGEIRSLRILDDQTGQEISSIAEGRGIRVQVEVGGEFMTPQTLVITADVNFNGQIEPTELREIVNIIDETSSFNEVEWPLTDDGPWPGNGTPTDRLTVNVSFAGQQLSRSLTVENVAPRLISRPDVTYSDDTNGDTLAMVRVSFVDPGMQDQHVAEVMWSDGITSSTVEWIAHQVCPQGNGKTMTVTRRLPPGVDARPVEVRVIDDDAGTARYGLQELNVAGNGGGLQTLELGGLITTAMDPALGEYVLSYDLGQIRLWDSPSRTRLILPYGAMAGGPAGLESVATIAYTGQPTVYVEGVVSSSTLLSLTWTSASWWTPSWLAMCNGTLLQAGSVQVNVMSIDLDIDSDNDNGFNFPENDAWEEYLEDSQYGIGKMIVPNDSHFTPVRLRLPAGLDPNDRSIRIVLSTFAEGRSSGRVQMWNRSKADHLRDESSKLAEQMGYTLRDLFYNPVSGGITIFLEATSVAHFHETKLGVDSAGKPGDFLRAEVFGLAAGIVPEDRVKWMAVNPDSFYPTLNDSPVIRDAFASEAVYGISDDANHALKLLNREEVVELIGDSLNGMPGTALNVVLNVLFGNVKGVFPIPKLKAGIYLDHTSPNPGSYILAFAGTEDLSDWVTNVENLVAPGEGQYWHATNATHLLAQVPAFRNMVVTGHSLGGGLAAAGAIAGNVRGVTFNASGFPEHSLLDPASGEPMFEQASIDRYYASASLIDNYAVYAWMPNRDGTIDASDILTWLQWSSLLAVDARGTQHLMEGLLNLTYYQRGATNQLAATLGSIKSLEELKSYLLGIGFYSSVFYISGAHQAMISSHKFPSIFYGLMHDDNGWNVYDDLEHPN